MNTLHKKAAGLGAIITLALGTAISIGPLAQAAATPLDLQSASCPSVVSTGQNSGCVTELQNLLKQQGYTLTVDGSFGPATLSAVKSFQTSAGLTADGLVGSMTKAKLYTMAPSVTATACTSLVLSSGSRGGCAATIQTALNNLIGAKLAVDGKFGAASAAAVKSFQAARGLTADGIVGPMTWAQLAKSQPSTFVDKEIAYAKANLGRDYATYDTDNRFDKYTAWCAYFASTALKRAGSAIPVASYGWVPNYTVNTTYTTYYTKAQIDSGAVVPQPGDLAIWNWHMPDYSRDHITIIISVASKTTVNGSSVYGFNLIGGNQGGSENGPDGDGYVTAVTTTATTATGGHNYYYGNLVGIARPTGK